MLDTLCTTRQSPLATQVNLNTLITYNPLSVRPETLLTEASRQMKENNIRHLPAVDEARKLVGIVSDLDLAQFLATRQFSLANGESGSAMKKCLVADCMAHEPISIELLSGPGVALRVILNKKIHSVPVVEARRLIGMITSTDFLREVSYGELPASRVMVACAMTDSHAIVSPEISVATAWAKMNEMRKEYLVIAVGECPLGIISQREFRQLNVSSKCLDRISTPLRQLIHAEPPRILNSAILREAASAMVDGKLKALAVVDQRNCLQGLLTEDDILTCLTPDLS